MQDQNAVNGTDVGRLGRATFVRGKRKDASSPGASPLRSRTALRLVIGLLGALLVTGSVVAMQSGPESAAPPERERLPAHAAARSG